MPELEGTANNRGEALQHHEKSRPRAQPHRQIDPPFARLTGGVKAIAGLRLDEPLHFRDDDVAPGQAPDIEGSGAADLERPKRIGERAAGRAQAGLKRKDARIRAVEPDSRRDLALARSIVGLPRRRVLDAVVGRRGDQGQPICQAIFDIGSKLELLIGRTRNEMPLRIESEKNVSAMT